MKDTLAPGLEVELSHAVTDAMAPPHLPVKVLSTPSMISLIEGTCFTLTQSHLDDGETTVGTHVCVSHTGPARSGETVRVHAKLRDINKRRLTFDIEVTAAGGTISTGTHERAVVTLDRMRGR